MPVPHPAKFIIDARGDTYADVARAIGYEPRVLRNVLTGRFSSWPKLRRRVADYLDLPEAKLFYDVGRSSS